MNTKQTIQAIENLKTMKKAKANNPKNIKMYELKKNRTSFPIQQVNNSKKIADYIRQFYSDDIGIYESFFLLTLDRALNTTGFVKISQGGIFGTVVDIKLVCKYAIESLCCSVVICHNHPSGNTTPSPNDDVQTQKVKQAMNMFDIKLLDHIILTENSYYSYADNNTL
jgi:DNA repair protein RadC